MCSVVAYGCCKPKITKTGPDRPPKPPDCDFHVFTTQPEGRWVEIAVIDDASDTRNIERFKEMIAEQVCEVGGDAAMVWMNGHGQYIKATVLAFSPPVAGPTAPPAPAPMPSPAAASPQGCQYDTQCKGNRVCVQGKCVAPEEPDGA